MMKPGIVISVCISLLLVSSCFLRREHKELPHIRSVIELGRYDDTTKGLLTGYNYYLLEKYAADNDATLDIRICDRDDCCIDSLRAGAIDILVIPYADSLKADSVLTSIPVDSISIWLVPHSDKHRLKILNRWIRDWHHDERFETTREKFLRTYDPLKKARAGIKADWISPYDSLIRAYADTLGWDWHMLAAVIFQESMFKIDARSHRGAMGLMQMMPGTASRMDAEDLMNPETSIRSGCAYLARLHKLYARRAANAMERAKMTLAAYNAGEGRMKDVLNYAAYRGVDSGRWDDIAAVIPEMSDSLNIRDLDTVKLGLFKGVETISYVDRVMSLTEAFRKICPE